MILWWKFVTQLIWFNAFINLLSTYCQVVDARAGPGIKSSMKIKNNKSPSSSKYKSPLKSKKMYAHSIPSSIYDMSGTTINTKIITPTHTPYILLQGVWLLYREWTDNKYFNS